MVGRSLSHYKVLEKIGEGGMGEVYIAEDTKLSRKVALKVLPAEMAENAERRARFEREAKAVAALDHPNIVTIHSVEEAEGVHFYTMQLVKGKTLTELIPKKGLPLNKFFEIAIPLADAVSAAHERGVIHRDLKPDNLMVSDEGRLKILDFGLAKLKPAYAEDGASELPTQSATAEGRILGTVAYMSPEQAEGKTIDHRSDIFSIGIILYEMATGERPFKGDTAASLLSSILKDKPQSATEVNPNLPRDLGKIIRRCLAKDAEDRLQTAKELRNELRELKQDIDSGEVLEGITATARSITSSKMWLVLAGTAVVVGAGLAYWLSQSLGESRESERPLVVKSTQLTSESRRELWPSLSLDGGFIIYASEESGNWDIYLQRVGGSKAINLTEDSGSNDTQPALSPDGEQIAFRSERDGEGIYVMGTTGELVRRLTDFGHDPSWSPDGETILFTSWVGSDHPANAGIEDSQLWSVNVSTGKTTLIREGQLFQPRWSPHQYRIAYYVSPRRGQVDIWTLTGEGDDPVPVTDDTHLDWNPIWSHEGDFLYFTSDRSGSPNIWRVRIEEDTGKVLGKPEPVTSGTGSELWHITLSRDGRHLAYSSFKYSINIQKVSFDPVIEKVVGEPEWVTTRGALHPDVSPDGKWLAFDYDNPYQPSAIVISIIRSDGRGLRQLTDTPYRDRYPRWSPDGKRMAFRSNRSGDIQIWVMKADGSDLKQLTYASGKDFWLPVWSPDGKTLTVGVTGEGTYVFDAYKSWMEESPTKLPPFNENGDSWFCPNSWSPDNRSLAGVIHDGPGGKPNCLTIYSFETHRYEKLNDLGDWPFWLSDNRRLLWQSSATRKPIVFSVLDTATGEHHEILSTEILGIAPDRVLSMLAISPDERTIYFDRRRDEADIWMLTLNEEK
jgi:serine/threonine protein kinase